jgi:hypothetical protein
MCKTLRPHAGSTGFSSCKSVTVFVVIVILFCEEIIIQVQNSSHGLLLGYQSNVFLPCHCFQLSIYKQYLIHTPSVLVHFSCRFSVLSKVAGSLHQCVVAIKPKAKENVRTSSTLCYITLMNLVLKYISF